MKRRCIRALLFSILFLQGSLGAGTCVFPFSKKTIAGLSAVVGVVSGKFFCDITFPDKPFEMRDVIFPGSLGIWFIALSYFILESMTPEHLYEEAEKMIIPMTEDSLVSLDDSLDAFYEEIDKRFSQSKWPFVDAYAAISDSLRIIREKEEDLVSIIQVCNKRNYPDLRAKSIELLNGVRELCKGMEERLRLLFNHENYETQKEQSSMSAQQDKKTKRDK